MRTVEWIVLHTAAAYNAKMDKAGIIVDSDARKTTQGGQLQGMAQPKPVAPPAAAPEAEDEATTPARVLQAVPRR